MCLRIFVFSTVFKSGVYMSSVELNGNVKFSMWAHLAVYIILTIATID